MAARQKGMVKWYNDEKGYGFITPEDGSKDIFVHFSTSTATRVFKTLAEGQMVQFAIADSIKGPCAVDVTPE